MNSEIELKIGVLELGLESDDVMLIVVNYVVGCMFLSCFGCVLQIELVNIFVIQFGV